MAQRCTRERAGGSEADENDTAILEPTKSGPEGGRSGWPESTALLAELVRARVRHPNGPDHRRTPLQIPLVGVFGE
jgi:hypothetical protein